MTASPAVTIRLVGESLEDTVYSVGIAEHVDVGAETFALIFSEGLPDEVDGYCIVAEPGQRTAYRAIERCELDRSTLRLVFTRLAAAALELPRELVLELEVSRADVETLEGGLHRVGVLANRPRA